MFYVSIPDLARQFNASVSTIQYWIAKGRIPAPSHRMGRRHFWTVDEAEKIVASMDGIQKWTRIAPAE